MPLDLFSEEIRPQSKPLDLFSEEIVQPQKGRYDWLTSGEQHIISPAVQEMQNRKLEITPTAQEIGKAIKWAGKQILGTGETALSLASGIAAWPISEIAGAAKLATSGADEARKTREQIANYLTYKPYTEPGQAATGLVGKGFEKLMLPAKKAGEIVEKATGSKNLGYVTKFGAELLTLKGLHIAGAKAKAKVQKYMNKPVLSKKVIKSLDKTEQKIFAKDAKQHGPEIAVSSIMEHRFRNAEMQIGSYLKKGDTQKAQAIYDKTIANINKLTTIDGPIVDTAANWGLDMFDKMPTVQKLKAFQGIKTEVPIEKPVVSKPETGKAQILKAKKPWEMTYQEHAAFFDKMGSKFSYASKIGKELGIESKAGEPIREKFIQGEGRKKVTYPGSLPEERWREAIIENAVKQGKSVPFNILEEYKGKEWADNVLKKVPENIKAQTLYSYGGKEVEPYGIPETPPILGREAGTIRVGKIPTESTLFTFSEKTIEDRYQAAKGIKKENILTRFNKALASIKNKTTRDIYENLPRTGEFMPLRNELLQLQKAKGIASHDAVRTIQEITTSLDRPSFDLFTRKVILDDLLKTSEKGKELPLGFTPESLLEESSRLNTVLKTQPRVVEALQRRSSMWDNLRQEYNSAMKNIGFNVENRLKNEAYFRHQVLEYVNARGLFGTGKRLKTPSSRGFLRRREGSHLDINTDYLQAESEVVAQMLNDIKIARSLKNIEKQYSIHEKIKQEFNAKKEELARQGITDWRQLIKKEYPGYDIWQPREGNVFFMSDSIPAQLAEELTSGKLKEVGITAKDLREILAVGGRRKELVLKNEIIDTLDNLYTSPSQNVISQANKKILRGWKVWTLISPRRYVKYNIRNLTGDADAVFVGNPSTFSEVPIAIKDLWQHFAKKEKMTLELRMWFDRGGFESTLQAQEMGEINNLKIFLDLQKPRGDFKNVPLKVWQTYWKKARMSTDFREAILRYAAFRDYLKQMKESGGSPKNFGASIPDEIMALSNDADKAFHLSNDLLGAYDRISISGKALREHLFPFWSWKEVNFKRYIQLFKNAANDKKLCEVLGRKATGGLAKTSYQAYRVGKFLVKATALWGMLEVYNNTRFPEEEKKLPKDIRDRPHIVFGTDKDGKIQYFSRIGAFGDFLEWFGLDAAPRYVRKWLDGSLSLEETAKEMAKSPVNVIAQGITPFAKMPAEIISRRSFFPDIFEPGIIRDRGYHFAKSLGLENEYKAIMDLPGEGYGKSIPGVFVYRLDPLQGAYSDIYEEKQRFLKKIGKLGEGFWLTPRGDALYNFKLALRYDDNNAAKKYLKSYFMLGGTIKGLGLSLNAMNPLFGLNKQEQEAFVKTLNEENRQKLAMAFKFWVDILALPAQPQANKPIDLFGGETNE